VYLIENNEYAMGTPLEKTAPTEDLSIRALGYAMARETIDGHDIFDVRAKVHAAVQRAREHNQPTLIEVKTYRYRGHSMADPQKYRTREDVKERQQRDAILLLGLKLEELGMGEVRARIEAEIEAEIQEAVEFAENSPFPDPATATNYTYIES
jgi:pyruvate dehydrogenase E1 component alpha subunit